MPKALPPIADAETAAEALVAMQQAIQSVPPGASSIKVGLIGRRKAGDKGWYWSVQYTMTVQSGELHQPSIGAIERNRAMLEAVEAYTLALEHAANDQ